MSDRVDFLKKLLALVIPVVVVLWSRYGNLKQIIIDYGSWLVPLFCFSIILAFLLFWLVEKGANARILIATVLSGLIPFLIVFVVKQIIQLEYVILISIGSAALFVIFRKEIRWFLF